MTLYEYKVIPAPRRGEKTKGAKTTSERFAQALSHLMNDLGRDGWEYQRADTLPCDERVGLTGKATAFHNMLVFRRTLPVDAARAVLHPPVLVAASEGTAPKISVFSAEAPAAPLVGPARGAEVAAQ